MLKSILVFILLFNQTAFADDCGDDVQVVTKGQVVKCDGVLLSPDASKKANEAIDDAKYYKGLSDKLYQRQSYTDKEIDTLDQRLKLYVDQSQTLATTVQEDKWQKFIYFGLGVLATGIAVYGAKQITK